jgi:hypothetical protein
MKVLGHVFAPKKGTVVDSLPAVIVLEKDSAITKFLTDTQIGEPDYPWLTVVLMPTKEFEAKFARTQDDLLAIAKIYREHARELGATPEALDALGHIIPMEEGTASMAISNSASEKAKSGAATTAKAAQPKTATTAKAASPAQETETHDVEVSPAQETETHDTEVQKPRKQQAAKPRAPRERRPSVSSRICELIMEGKLSDDEIFAVVKREFNLDDSKRGYVGWNRSHLRKQGLNPPGPIGGNAPKAAKETKSSTSAPRKSTSNKG